MVIDSDTGEFEIGDTEDDAERRFIARYGSDRSCVHYRAAAFVEGWVLGTSPKMTSRVAFLLRCLRSGP